MKVTEHLDVWRLMFDVRGNTTQAFLPHQAGSHGKFVKETKIRNLFSNQEETDSRIVLYCAYTQEHGYGNAQIISPDSDAFFILLHHAGKFDVNILFDRNWEQNAL